jgi:hypothetical protein
MKTMKPLKLMVFLFIFATQNTLVAQNLTMIKDNDVEGIYITYNDYINNRLTTPTDHKHNGDDILLKQFFISPEIVAIEEGNTIIYLKDSIFAIKLTNGENYRFINRTPYQIIDTTYLYIYEHNTMKMEIKSFGPHRRIKEKPVSYYYFSLKIDGQQQPLTLQNLKNLSVNHTFKKKLQQIIGDNNQADKLNVKALNDLLNEYGLK